MPWDRNRPRMSELTRPLASGVSTPERIRRSGTHQWLLLPRPMAQGGGSEVGAAAVGAQCMNALGLARQQRQGNLRGSGDGVCSLGLAGHLAVVEVIAPASISTVRRLTNCSIRWPPVNRCSRSAALEPCHGLDGQPVDAPVPSRLRGVLVGFLLPIRRARYLPPGYG